MFDAEERVLMAANLNFTVDTHLLRELGELLVGRDSTAVIELVKNSYDADATVVRLHACNLRDPQVAELIVEDNGNGMTLDRFRTAFLRIAGRDRRGSGGSRVRSLPAFLRFEVFRTNTLQSRQMAACMHV